MQNMHTFVDQVAQRGGNPTRQQIGQTARVNVKRGHHPNTGQKQDPARAHILREGMVNNQPQRGAFDDSVYDGDTVTSKSHVQVEDSQLDAHVRPMGHPNQMKIEEEESSGGDESENGREYEEGDEEERELRSQDIQQNMNNLLNQMPLPFGVFDPRGGDSYPPTTSGCPDDEEYEDEEPFQTQQMNKLSAPPHHFQSEPRVLGMPPPAAHSTHKMPLSRPPQIGRSSHAPATQAQHMMRQNLAHRQSPTPPATKVMQRQTVYANPTPPQTGPHFTGHSTAQPKSRSDTGGSPRPRSQATVRAPQHEPQPEPEMRLDYDQDALSKMSYKELHDQDFDDNPAKPTSVFRKKEADKSLADRLAAVQQMEDDKKRDFLASLSLDEWEEAGDWFLERFGQVMNKMKEARKERRRLAKGFEEEVFKRHEKVQGKKRDIDEAMSEMSRNGQEVLRAGTPGRKKVKT